MLNHPSNGGWFLFLNYVFFVFLYFMTYHDIKYKEGVVRCDC